jgi:hypothetical protein
MNRHEYTARIVGSYIAEIRYCGGNLGTDHQDNISCVTFATVQLLQILFFHTISTVGSFPFTTLNKPIFIKLNILFIKRALASI